jgi:hypothetical protein
MPCSKKRSWTGCNFELKAVPSNLKKGHIDVYAFSRHNHPFESEGFVYHLYFINSKSYREKVGVPKGKGIDAGCKSPDDFSYLGQH